MQRTESSLHRVTNVGAELNPQESGEKTQIQQ